MRQISLPAFSETIRFRLSLAIAVVVFTLGSLVIGGLYFWEQSTLVEPVLMARTVVIRDLTTGDLIETEFELIFPEESQRVEMEKLELEAYRRALRSLRTSSSIALSVLFVGSFGAGWFLSGWALAPVRRITGVANGITASDLGRRIGLTGPRDELRDMGDTFDSMLDRLEMAFDDQRRFVAEASHELRNPLAVARTNLELALNGGSEQEVRDAARIAHDATQRMSELVDQMLDEARAALPVNATEHLDLSDLAEIVAADHRAAARKRNVAIAVETEPTPVIGDRLALRRAANNLLSNAVRLAPEGSQITLAVNRQGGKATLSVTDEGPGLSAEDRSHVFDQFWQGSGQEHHGVGLGLAIVRRIAERHGGGASVEAVDTGSRFTISLPSQ
ncbi:MAG: HAMP domain-containing protein [Acidimicrobiales bacterium]|nr:HAMP domain-containing protein [Acidimicrobiales bacterium]